MIKGSVIRDFIEWYGGAHGTGEMRRIAEKLPADMRAMLDLDHPTFNLAGTSWYPSRLASSIFDVVAEGRTREEITLFLREANRGFIERGAVNSIYRFFLEKLVTSPEMYALCVPRFWRQWHSTGERRVKIVRPGLAESSVSNWPGHHRILCTMTIETMCAVLETIGCNDVTWERVACVSEGASECKTLVRWT
ncbi:MAG: hypothetical protein ACRELY_33030 [Polyangiaceae bacterium]